MDAEDETQLNGMSAKDKTELNDMAADDRTQPNEEARATLKTAMPENASSTPAALDGSEKAEPKQPSRAKRVWDSLGLDFLTVTMMFKGSLPPTIALAAYQATPWAKHFSTIGYLVAIASVLGFCIMPRGRFIQTMILNVFTVCLATAVNLLALYCATQARLHTTPPHRPLAAYNSSSSAVLAIWLIAQTYVANVVRAARPQFQFPVIIYSIFTNVSMTNGVQFPTMPLATKFMEKLLEAFLTGFAIATGVHFVVFPVSSRKVVFKEMTGYMMCIGGVLKAETAALQSLESFDPVAVREKEEADAADATQSKKHHKSTKPAVPGLATPAMIQVREAFTKLVELHTKIHADVTPAKREIAAGKLESHDITEIWSHLRKIFVPIMGLSSGIELLQRYAAKQHWDRESENEAEERARRKHLANVHFMMKQLHEPFARVAADIDIALKHVLITLEFVKPPKQKGDVESHGQQAVPGTVDFAAAFTKQVEQFYQTKKQTLKDWCKEHGIDLPDDFMDSTYIKPEKILIKDEHLRERYQRQLFFTLFLEYLLYRAAKSVLDLVEYAEKQKQEGALKRNKLIFPGSRTLYDWLGAVFSREDLSNDGHYLSEMSSGTTESVYIGEEFASKKDPEHLPPQNWFEALGDRVRKIPNLLRGEESAFGFRVACATFTIGIVCYLERTQSFFLRNRLLWAMIMVAISMTRTSGQSVFNYVLRVLGTVIAMIGSYIIWYIVVGHTAGVLVFLWLWIGCATYFILKFPKLIVIAILSLVTAILVIGVSLVLQRRLSRSAAFERTKLMYTKQYELQVQEVGVKASQASGQPAYPTYELAPYRLATVSGGLVIAFIWTMFPYPVSESSEIRRDAGATIYLLANFYSIVRETVNARIKGTDGDVNTKGTHGYHLNEAFDAVIAKLLILLSNLKTNTTFSKFQVKFGGKFPRQEYEGLIDSCYRTLRHTALIQYASSTFSLHTGNRPDGPSQWSNDFRKLLVSTATTSHQITSMMALLSSSLTNGQPLPPYLHMPEPFKLVKQLEHIDADLLSVRHIAEPEYSAFAVMQVCAQAINDDFEELARHVKNLVGTIDFSFHSKVTSLADDASSSDDLADPQKEKLM